MRLNSVELQRFQQNRYPFLMIDIVEEVVPGNFARGYKNLSLNEWYFPVHFPGAPNMPGALQVEALAQMFTVAITTLPGLEGSYTRFISSSTRFRKEVVPGDRFEIYAEVKSWKRGLASGFATGSVSGDVAIEAELMISIPDIFDSYLPKKHEL